MQIPTVTMDCVEEAALIKILIAIHRREPEARFTDPETGRKYVLFIDMDGSVMDVCCSFSSSSYFAEVNQDKSEAGLIWWYIRSEVLREIEYSEMAKGKYVDVVR